MDLAIQILHRDSVLPIDAVDGDGLSKILEEEDGDDIELAEKKRRAKELMTDLIEILQSPNKKRRV